MTERAFSSLFICIAIFIVGVNSACNPACGSGERCVFSTCISTSWPLLNAKWEIRIHCVNLIEPEFSSSLSQLNNVIRGGPDTQWLHLHRGQANAQNSTLWVEFADKTQRLAPSSTGLQLRYKIRGVPVSPWLDPPFRFDIHIDQPGFDQALPEDGIFDLSAEIRPDSSGTANVANFIPYPAFVHIFREGFPTSPMTPAGLDEANWPDDGGDTRSFFTPTPIYVDSSKRKFYGYPLNASVDPWHTLPHQTDLYVEQMGPRTPLFASLPMWWADNFHDDLPFIRGFPPKHSEEHNGLRVLNRHERFPVKDGPRGVGWMSTYVSGLVDSQGRFAFAETSGRVAYLYPDGEIVTIAGWVVAPGKDPIWYKKPTSVVRKNMALRGTWENGQYPNENGGLRTPLDVAIDPLNENILYATGFDDHCIWKIEIIDLAAHNVRVSVFAGDVNHTSGTADGTGTSARFFGPTSIVFDPVADVMYVADQDSGRIRRITRSGVVTTLYGETNTKIPGNIEFPYAPSSVISGCTNWWFQSCAKGVSKMEVGADSGEKPDIFMPQTIRVDSHGNIILLELGYGTIRRINPTTHETKILGRVDMKHRQWTRGWAWMDVDRWGNAGPKDGIYWCKFVGEVFGASHGPNLGDPGCEHMYKGIGCTNSTCANSNRRRCPWGTSANMFSENYGYIPPDNNDQRSYLLFTQSFTGHPNGFGLVPESKPPHYPWLVAVDPRGAVLIGGGGEHGIARIRKRRDDDPVPIDASYSWDHYYAYWNGRAIFNRGTPTAIWNTPTSEHAVGLLTLYSFDGHNLLGLPNTWAISNMNDTEILEYFDVPESITSHSEARKFLLTFLKAGSGTTSGRAPVIIDLSATSGSGSSGTGTTSSSSGQLDDASKLEDTSTSSLFENTTIIGAAAGAIGLIAIVVIAIVIWRKKKASSSSWI